MVECFGQIAAVGAEGQTEDFGGGFLGRGGAQEGAVQDGSELAAAKLERVLTNDPAMGVLRHVDAGYDRAREVAAERGLWTPP